jgi:hypothetical protein
MKNKQLWFSANILLVVALVIVIIMAAAQQARDNALAAFSHYDAQLEEALRTPIEQRAIEVLGPLLAQPQQDKKLALAALKVLRSSPAWPSLAPQIYHQLRVAMEARLNNPRPSMLRVRAIYELMVESEYADKEIFAQRIISLAGNRSGLINDVQDAVVQLQMATSDADIQDAMERIDQAWDALHARHEGHALNWLAQQEPAFTAATAQAGIALERLVRKLMEPFGIPVDAHYGQALPDQVMIGWFVQQAAAITDNRPEQQQQLRHAQQLYEKFTPTSQREPVVAVAIRIACQQQSLTWLGLLLGVGVIIILVSGFFYALSRLRRGPQPVDVNAETMENVEPIDLDTDAETRSRSSGSITDVG